MHMKWRKGMKTNEEQEAKEKEDKEKECMRKLQRSEGYEHN